MSYVYSFENWLFHFQNHKLTGLQKQWEDGPSVWVPEPIMSDLEEVPGFWLQTDQAIWIVN